MKDLIEIMDYEMGNLNNAISYLQESYTRCRRIAFQSNYSEDQLIEIEALTSRFSRASDIILKKIFRYIDELELEMNKSIIDRIHSAEKREIITSARQWQEIRNIRNLIAHEYSSNSLKELFIEVMNYTPEIIDTYYKINQYIKDLKSKI